LGFLEGLDLAFVDVAKIQSGGRIGSRIDFLNCQPQPARPAGESQSS
jgi:hypothetical protein